MLNVASNKRIRIASITLKTILLNFSPAIILQMMIKGIASIGKKAINVDTSIILNSLKLLCYRIIFYFLGKVNILFAVLANFIF